jgi:hypothetical protein
MALAAAANDDAAGSLGSRVSNLRPDRGLYHGGTAAPTKEAAPRLPQWAQKAPADVFVKKFIEIDTPSKC